MKNNEIIKEINDILFNIQVKNEKLEGFNILISDKLESIESYENEEVAVMLYNAQRYIGKYKLLSYSISDKVAEIDKDVQRIYKLLDTLRANNESEAL